MPDDFSVSEPVLFAFLTVLARVASAFVFVPFPGGKGAADPAKAVLSLFMTLALYPCWPPVKVTGFSQLAGWVLLEAAFGLTIGLAVGFLTEAFTTAAHLIGLQAGYSYASTIDPTSQNDTTVLQTILQLVAGLLFFAGGIDRYVIRVFAKSLEVLPPGSFHASSGLVAAVQNLGSVSLSAALQLALPVIGLLILLDICLALLGRMHSQMQLLSLAFPIKMVGSLAALAAIAALLPGIFERTLQHTVLAISGAIR